MGLIAFDRLCLRRRLEGESPAASGSHGHYSGPHGDRYSSSDLDRHTDADSHGNTNCHFERDADPYNHPDPNPDDNRNAYADTDENREPDANSHIDANYHSDRDANRDTLVRPRLSSGGYSQQLQLHGMAGFCGRCCFVH